MRNPRRAPQITCVHPTPSKVGFIYSFHPEIVIRAYLVPGSVLSARGTRMN